MKRGRNKWNRDDNIEWTLKLSKSILAFHQTSQVGAADVPCDKTNDRGTRIWRKKESFENVNYFWMEINECSPWRVQEQRRVRDCWTISANRLLRFVFSNFLSLISGPVNLTKLWMIKCVSACCEVKFVKYVLVQPGVWCQVLGCKSRPLGSLTYLYGFRLTVRITSAFKVCDFQIRVSSHSSVGQCPSVEAGLSNVINNAFVRDWKILPVWKTLQNISAKKKNSAEVHSKEEPRG